MLASLSKLLAYNNWHILTLRLRWPMTEPVIAMAAPTSLAKSPEVPKIVSIVRPDKRDPPPSGCTGLTAVTISDSVTLIGNLAFAGCTELIDVAIPESVISIGEYAFAGCTRLIAVSIPDSVTSIADGAFHSCA
eukprot:gene20790-14326_t